MHYQFIIIDNLINLARVFFFEKNDLFLAKLYGIYICHRALLFLRLLSILLDMEQKQTRLSVNINKVAWLRNARGGNLPNLLQVAQDCEKFGAEGITVHPRPDERHIHYKDVYDLKPLVTTEFNIEGYPNERFPPIGERGST